MNKILTSAGLTLCVVLSVVACTPPWEAARTRVQETRDTEAFSKYRNDVARSNIEREKAGQAPMSILSREEWEKSEAAKKAAASKK